MSRLVAPTPEAIGLINAYSPRGVVEIGAGDGCWLAALWRGGIDAVGFDVAPRHSIVRRGDHLAVKFYKSRTLLIVWPPDGAAVQEWIAAYAGRTVVLVTAGLQIEGHWRHMRIDLGSALARFRLAASGVLPPGTNGTSYLGVYQDDDAA